MVSLRNQSRDELIAARRGVKHAAAAAANAEFSLPSDENDVLHFNDDMAQTIWSTYMNALGLHYTDQHTAVTNAVEMLTNTNWLRATDVILQSLNLEQVTHIVDVLVEVATSTWEHRDEYVTATLEILFQLTSPLEQDAIPLIAQTRLVWFMSQSMQHSEPPIPEHITLFGELIGNMCTHSESHQSIIESDLLSSLCRYVVLVDPNEEVLFALRNLTEPFKDMTPGQMRPILENLENIFKRITEVPTPLEFGEFNLLEALNFVMQYTPDYVRMAFTTNLVQHIINSLRGHAHTVFCKAAEVFANISYHKGGYDVVLASCPEFMHYIENRLLATSKLPDERVFLYKILTNLIITTSRFQILTKNWNIKEVVMASLESGSGMERIEAAYLWGCTIQKARSLDEIEVCLWPLQGWDAVRYLIEGIQFTDFGLNENLILAILSVAKMCKANLRMPDGRPSIRLLRRLFKNTNLRDMLDTYHISVKVDSYSGILIDQLDQWSEHAIQGHSDEEQMEEEEGDREQYCDEDLEQRTPASMYSPFGNWFGEQT